MARHASNHTPFTTSLVDTIEAEGRLPFKSATYLSLAWAGDVGLRRRVEAYNIARPHSSLGCATPAAFAAERESNGRV